MTSQPHEILLTGDSLVFAEAHGKADPRHSRDQPQALAALWRRPIFHDFLILRGWCPNLDLNQGHTDFQSVALPTELFGLPNRRGV